MVAEKMNRARGTLLEAQNKKYRYPWQGGNHFALLVDGPAFFTAMLRDIASAQHYILLEMYLVQPGCVSEMFFSALRAAVSRGVDVYLLIDDFGARSIDENKRQELMASGIRLAIYNPLKLYKRALLLFRDHRKLMVVDGICAYVGGAALTDDFDAAVPDNTWRENMLRIQGSNVNQWQALFCENWLRWENQGPSLRDATSVTDDQQGRVTITHGPYFLEIKRSFLKHVKQASQRVWLCTAYFAPSRKLLRALCKAGQRGVDVRLLIPGPITDHPMARYLAQHAYARLLRHGVRIFEYQPRFMHAKLVLCDDWVSLGSCNIDRWNLNWNLDANQEIQNARFAGEITEMFAADFSQSEEITAQDWAQRSFVTRAKIWFWATYIRMADILFSRLRILRHWRYLRRKNKQDES